MNHHRTTVSTSDGRSPTRWQRVLDAMTAAGHADGADTAAWWRQDTLGGRANGDVNAVARAVLAGIDDGDPAVLDALPTASKAEDRVAQLYAEHAGPHAPGWDCLNAPCQAEALDAYRDAHDTAVHDEVARHCHDTLPTGGDPGHRSTLDTGDLNAVGGSAISDAPSAAAANHQGGVR